MTLATHILVAGSITKPFLGQANTFVIFIISIFSHYLADAIPHYDYKLLSIEWKEGQTKKDLQINRDPKQLTIDLLNIAIDVAIGTAVLLLCVRPEVNFSNFITYTLIIVGSILPDALQPIFIMYKKFPMTLIQNFHDFWHAKTKLKLNKTAVLSQGTLFLIATFINYF